MAGVQSRRKDRTTRREEIIAYVRRFGPVTTTQIRDKFRYGNSHGLNSRLQKFKELERAPAPQGKVSIWRVAK